MAVDLAFGFGELAARFFGFLGFDSRGLENASRPLRLRLDVDIGRLGIELGSMPKQSSIGNRLQYQIHCLNVDKIVRWNSES